MEFVEPPIDSPPPCEVPGCTALQYRNGLCSWHLGVKEGYYCAHDGCCYMPEPNGYCNMHQADVGERS